MLREAFLSFASRMAEGKTARKVPCCGPKGAAPSALGPHAGRGALLWASTRSALLRGTSQGRKGDGEEASKRGSEKGHPTMEERPTEKLLGTPPARPVGHLMEAGGGEVFRGTCSFQRVPGVGQDQHSCCHSIFHPRAADRARLAHVRAGYFVSIPLGGGKWPADCA